MTKTELKEKAQSLPLAPGVYLMQNKANEVIYVGKAKKLRNRVSQYFLESSTHTPKTKLMVSKVDHFDVIIAASEFEALMLECSLIKRYMPKYNILLKDDKGYPWVRLDLNLPYPEFSLSSKVQEDGAKYFGPFGGRFLTQKVIDTLRLTFRLPNCGRVFPRDIGKERPCINYQMKNCDGWCTGTPDREEYLARIRQVQSLLSGNYKAVSEEIREEMLAASDEMEFERAAQLRDRMNAILALGKKQLVTAGRMADTDAIGYYETETKGCFAVLHYIGGNLLEKDYQILASSGNPEEALGSLVKQYYLKRNAAPKQILLPFEMEDAELFEQLLLQNLKSNVRIRVPKRGDGLHMSEIAAQNAREEAERVTSRDERLRGTLRLLEQMLGTENRLRRMESYDISNLAGTDIVASMVTFVDGKPLKSAYRRFRVEGLDNQDDYASMRQVLHRRFAHYLAGDKGFETAPDLLLIDGGAEHAETVRAELADMGIFIPIYGMVKDHRHRTRALVTPDGREIGISTQQSVFALIGRIQEETHRFAITYNRKLRSRRVQGSSLEQISGIGEKRRADLLHRFKTISAISEASLAELSKVLPKDAAMAVFTRFHPEEDSQ